MDLDRGAPLIRVPPNYTDIGGGSGVSGGQLLEVARQHGLEGVVGKRLRSRYEPGRRSPSWIKTALFHAQEVVVGGWTAGQGGRAGTLGSLLLGAHDAHGRLRYLGDVGTGFTERMLDDLAATFAPRVRPDPPFVNPPRLPDVTWIEPDLVAEIAFTEWTREGTLRHPSFKGLRDDKPAADVVRES